MFTTALTFALFCSINASLITQQSKFIDCLLLVWFACQSRGYEQVCSAKIFSTLEGHLTANVNA